MTNASPVTNEALSGIGVYKELRVGELQRHFDQTIAAAIQGGMHSSSGEWLLLLQLDSYWSGNLLWGDNGRLFFWVKATDLKKKKLETVELIALEHVQGRQASQLLELLRVVIDGRGGHFQRETTAPAGGLGP